MLSLDESLEITVICRDDWLNLNNIIRLEINLSKIIKIKKIILFKEIIDPVDEIVVSTIIWI